MTQLLEGLIVSDQSGFFRVELEDGRICTCRLRGRLMEAAQSSDIAAIGDRVNVQMSDDESGTIEVVLPRTSVLSRAVRTMGNRGAGQAEREQVIIANADRALFVFAAAQPAPALRLLDRFLVAGEASGIEELIVVVNKIDLVERAEAERAFEPYARIGYRILYTSAVLREGIDALRGILRGHISVFTGPSGVGKTSLLNLVQPELGRRVREVSRARQEGLHTTRDSVLIKLDGGGYLADTPGLRTFSVWDVEPDELDAYFVEIAPYGSACRFGDCSHTTEPGCAVLRALEEGEISRARYENYLTLRDELKESYVVY